MTEARSIMASIMGVSTLDVYKRQVFCIGNPIYNAEGEVIASFSVSGIKGLSTQADRERWIEEAKKMGRRINAITQKQN